MDNNTPPLYEGNTVDNPCNFKKDVLNEDGVMVGTAYCGLPRDHEESEHGAWYGFPV